MELLASLVVLVVVGAAIVGPAVWILRPVDLAAKDRRHPAQFSLADVLCLFFLVQWWMAPLHAWVPAGDNRIWIFDVFGWGATGSLWWLSVQTLARAGVLNTWHRSIFLAVVLPLALCGTTAVLVLGTLIWSLLGQWERGGKIALSVGAAVAMILAIWACGLFTRWIVAQAVPVAEKAESWTLGPLDP